MKTLWLVREPCTVWYDVKPIHETLGTEKMDSSIEIELNDTQYTAYIEAVKIYNFWQRVFERKINGR